MSIIEKLMLLFFIHHALCTTKTNIPINIQTYETNKNEKHTKKNPICTAAPGNSRLCLYIYPRQAENSKYLELLKVRKRFIGTIINSTSKTRQATPNNTGRYQTLKMCNKTHLYRKLHYSLI